MSMEMNSVTSGITTRQTGYTTKVDKNTSNSDAVSKTADKAYSGESATYEKGSIEPKATYSINKMSKEERAALVNQLKADAEQRQSQFLDIVRKTISGQAGAFGKANDSAHDFISWEPAGFEASEKSGRISSADSIWRTLASGNFTVDAATKAQAQKDIGEDGYWGVKQTSQRLFDFASALAGDDPEKMKKMQEAMEKGFKQATKSWGGKLPGISQDTLAAANKLFDDYYNSKGVQTTE